MDQTGHKKRPNVQQNLQDFILWDDDDDEDDVLPARASNGAPLCTAPLPSIDSLDQSIRVLKRRILEAQRAGPSSAPVAPKSAPAHLSAAASLAPALGRPAASLPNAGAVSEQRRQQAPQPSSTGRAGPRAPRSAVALSSRSNAGVAALRPRRAPSDAAVPLAARSTPADAASQRLRPTMLAAPAAAVTADADPTPSPCSSSATAPAQAQRSSSSFSSSPSPPAAQHRPAVSPPWVRDVNEEATSSGHSPTAPQAALPPVEPQPLLVAQPPPAAQLPHTAQLPRPVQPASDAELQHSASSDAAPTRAPAASGKALLLHRLLLLGGAAPSAIRPARRRPTSAPAAASAAPPLTVSPALPAAGNSDAAADAPIPPSAASWLQASTPQPGGCLPLAADCPGVAHWQQWRMQPQSAVTLLPQVATQPSLGSQRSLPPAAPHTSSISVPQPERTSLPAARASTPAPTASQQQQQRQPKAPPPAAQPVLPQLPQSPCQPSPQPSTEAERQERQAKQAQQQQEQQQRQKRRAMALLGGMGGARRPASSAAAAAPTASVAATEPSMHNAQGITPPAAKRARTEAPADVANGAATGSGSPFNS